MAMVWNRTHNISEMIKFTGIVKPTGLKKSAQPTYTCFLALFKANNWQCPSSGNLPRDQNGYQRLNILRKDELMWRRVEWHKYISELGDLFGN